MDKSLSGAVALPGSKSESNRVLMIAAYGGLPPSIANLSDAHDTVLLQHCLQQIAASASQDLTVVDCEDAGTVARFLLTYLASHEGKWLLTGSPRMLERPMKPLVDTLLQLGADIRYQGRQGYLPVLVMGHPLRGGEAHIDGSQSSQFVSSILLAAPCWTAGLRLRMETTAYSQPYIGMTVGLMRHFGVPVTVEGDTITVPSHPYMPKMTRVSPDWSSASYWYEFAALADECDLLLKDLCDDSLQGDRAVAEMYTSLGVTSRFEPEGVRLSKHTQTKTGNVPLSFNLSDTPDLFPALVVTCVALHRPVTFQGIRNLAFKESNRVESMLSELSKLYTFINIIGDDKLVIEKSSCMLIDYTINDLLIHTYQDHRVAMAFAPLRCRFPFLHIDHPETVKKSYPKFWNEIQRLMEP